MEVVGVCEAGGWNRQLVGTDSCQVRHVGVVQAGTLHVTHEDGTEEDLDAGEAYVIEPGHDAWVVGDDGFVAFEFETRAAPEFAQG